ncbi:Thiamine kinase [Tistlia consotensis]|uniref:Thiamine kinase n=1 Tax=Tistlia consotensis USBA 355 TaxID=560819 RepID=A0A1Y6BY65_9PROT|nr:choline/ethanolamine kinase family protein [Tistlia consotensis]SMF36004.1 Thiamine kinase [Tistlia consotensis USBA 355]SNR71221.1 Thiamine kinase [Tistlia consotensis]
MVASSRDPAARVAGLSLWSGPVEPRPITGGITNTNFLVEDGAERFFVRVGADIPVHGVMRFNELAAARAAEAAGISPAVVHAEPGVLVIRFVEGRSLTEADLREPAMLERAVPLVRRCHREITRYLRGPVLMFWVFHILRSYAGVLRDAASPRVPLLADLLERAERLERAVGPIEVVFGHNDLLPANFLDDGERLWLIDWDYAGFNSPFFDLGGLSSNSQLAPEAEELLLGLYFGRAPTGDDRRALAAMKAASLLRESLWSMVSEIHSGIDFDFDAYTAENLARFERAWAAFLPFERN